jgi:hypothetical protein
MLSRGVWGGGSAGSAKAATRWRRLTNGAGSKSGTISPSRRGGLGGVRSVAQPGRVSAPPSGWAAMTSTRLPSRRTLQTTKVWPSSG